MSEEEEIDDSEIGDRLAPEGAWFVCYACGKVSKTKYGFSTKEKTPGWDESCMLNSSPHWEKDVITKGPLPSGRVVRLAEKADVVPPSALKKIKEEG